MCKEKHLNKITTKTTPMKPLPNAIKIREWNENSKLYTHMGAS